MMPPRRNARGQTLRQDLESMPGDETMADATFDQSNVSFGTRLGSRAPQFPPSAYAGVDVGNEEEDDDDIDDEEVDPGALNFSTRQKHRTDDLPRCNTGR